MEINNFSVEFQPTPEMARAIEELHQEAAKLPSTIYGQIGGKCVPIANIERHPDCPSDIYNAFLKSLLL